MTRKHIYIYLISLMIIFDAFSQKITLEECHDKALVNYPLVKQFDLIKKSEEYNISNAGKGYLPQVAFSAKATYQSEVVEIPISIPGINIPSIKKDQYQVVAEVNQLIWDGGMINASKKYEKANAALETSKLESELFTIRDRVNQMYLGILLINEQLKQNQILQKELQNNFDRVSACIVNGVGNEPDLDAVKVEQINAFQKRTELISARKSYLEMLSFMTGINIDENTELISPVVDYSSLKGMNNNRPELKVFDAGNELLDSKINAVRAGKLPKIGVFLQGGYGRPGLNMLKNEFSPYYIGGVKLSWNLGGFYTSENNMSLIKTGKYNLESQRETFLFNTNLKTLQLNNEIEKISELIKNDNEIINLRSNIRKASEKKVENGTLSVSELVRDINSENAAMQTKSLHEIQLLLAVYNLKNALNN